MAKKLTAEQKAVNKEATKLRDRAYHRRNSAYLAALDAAQKAVDTGSVGQAAMAANNAYTEALKMRDRLLRQVDEAIEALKAQREALNNSEVARLTPLAEARNQTMAARSEALNEARECVKEEFKDVAGCYGPASWKSIDEFVPFVACQNNTKHQIQFS